MILMLPVPDVAMPRYALLHCLQSILPQKVKGIMLITPDDLQMYSWKLLSTFTCEADIAFKESK